MTMGGYIYAIGGLGVDNKVEESVERYKHNRSPLLSYFKTKLLSKIVQNGQ